MGIETKNRVSNNKMQNKAGGQVIHNQPMDRMTKK